MNINEEKKSLEISHGSHEHSPMKHMLHMAICCGLPIVLILSLPAISAFSPSSGRTIASLIPFLCPIMMVLMIPMMMGKGHGNCCDNSKQEGKLKKLPQKSE